MKLIKARTDKGPNKGCIIPQTYYTPDRRFYIEKGASGWNVQEKDERGFYRYSFSCDTLKEVRDSLDLL